MRERIDRLLANLIEDYPLVWVCATAGAGKTTAVTQAGAATRRARVAWLTLDGTDAAAGPAHHVPGGCVGRRRGVRPRGWPPAALAARLPHTEAAGLLAEAVGQTPVLLVIDEVERIAHAPEALAVLASFVRYAPPELRVVMISRVEVTIALDSTAALGGAVTISESDLVFRTDEAAQALALAGRADMDPDAMPSRSTGGWVAGVLFEAWRSNSARDWGWEVRPTPCTGTSPRRSSTSSVPRIVSS